MAWEHTGNLNCKSPDLTKRREIPDGWLSRNLDQLATELEMSGEPLRGIYISSESGDFRYYTRQKGKTSENTD